MTLIAAVLGASGAIETGTVSGRITVPAGGMLPEMVVYLEPADAAQPVPAPAQQLVVVSQRGAKFSPALVVVSVGQSVEFRNDELTPGALLQRRKPVGQILRLLRCEQMGIVDHPPGERRKGLGKRERCPEEQKPRPDQRRKTAKHRSSAQKATVGAVAAPSVVAWKVTIGLAP